MSDLRHSTRSPGGLPAAGGLLRSQALRALVAWARKESPFLKSSDIRLKESRGRMEGDRQSDRLLVDILLQEPGWPHWLAGHLAHYRRGMTAFVTKTETEEQQNWRSQFVDALSRRMGEQR